MNARPTCEDAWRFQYRIRPYLSGASEAQLSERLGDILRNTYTLTGEGKLGVLLPDQGGLMWGQKLIDIQLEYYRRNQDMEEAVRPDQIPFNRATLDLVRPNLGLVGRTARKLTHPTLGN